MAACRWPPPLAPEAIFWVFAFPVLMTLALGVAFRAQKPQPIPIGVVSTGSVAAEEARALSATPDVAVVHLPAGEVDIALRNGRVDLVVEPGVDGRPPTYRFDPTRHESRAARLAADAALQRARGTGDTWQAQSREMSAPGSRYIDWVVPGLLGMNIMSTGLWGIGFSVVQARMKKLLKRLTATPMRRSHYLLSHIFSRLLFLGLEAIKRWTISPRRTPFLTTLLKDSRSSQTSPATSTGSCGANEEPRRPSPSASSRR